MNFMDKYKKEMEEYDKMEKDFIKLANFTSNISTNSILRES